MLRLSDVPMRLLVIVLALLSPALLSPVHAAAQCVIRGRADQLSIRVEAIDDTLIVTGHAVEVELGTDLAHSIGRMQVPIAFEGRVDALMSPFHLQRGRRLAEGTLRPGGRAEVHLIAGGGMTLHVAHNLTATLSAVPCDVLSLTAHDGVDASVSRPFVTHAIGANVELSLYADSTRSDVVATLRTSDEGAECTVSEIANGRAHLTTHFEFAEVNGWVDAALLTTVSPHEPDGFGEGSGRGGCMRTDHWYSYRGPAEVRVGAIISGPDGTSWARVTRRLRALIVGVRAGDAHTSPVELLELRGFESLRCGNELNFDLATVPRDDVLLPRTPSRSTP